MAFLIKRETGASSAPGGKNLNKPSRRFTKDDISGPTLLPCGGSQSLPNSTSTLKDAMKGHKRGKSEPFPASRGGWASLIGGRWSSGITKLVISGIAHSRNTTDSGFQTGSQSIQIIFPQPNKDKSLPTTPRLKHLSLMASELPNATFTNLSPKSTAPPTTKQERTIVCNTMVELVGQDNAEYAERQFIIHRENEDVEDMYATNVSMFGDLSIESDQNLEPAWDDKSMARPTSVCTAKMSNCSVIIDNSTVRPTSVCTVKATAYSVVIGDDSSVYYTAAEGDDHERIGVPYVPTEGTLLARMSKSLDDAEIPHTIRKVDSVVPLPGLQEGGDELKAMNAPVDMVLQVYREGLDDLEEELLAKEIIFRRGSRPFLRTHTRKRSVEEAQEVLTRRKAKRFPSSFSVEEDLAMFGAEFLLEFFDDPEERNKGTYDEAEDENRPATI